MATSVFKFPQSFSRSVQKLAAGIHQSQIHIDEDIGIFHGLTNFRRFRFLTRAVAQELQRRLDTPGHLRPDTEPFALPRGCVARFPGKSESPSMQPERPAGSDNQMRPLILTEMKCCAAHSELPPAGSFGKRWRETRAHLHHRHATLAQPHE